VAVGERGMTLIEVTVAAAVVLSIGGAATVRARADACVAAQVEALRALPFDDPSGAGATPVADLLGAVFPHAETARNTATAFFTAPALDGRPAGTFVTLHDAACGPLTVAATFVVADVDGFRPLDPARLAGYDHAAGTPPPADGLLVSVSARWQSGPRGGVVRRTVVIADRPVGLCPLATPSPA